MGLKWHTNRTNPHDAPIKTTRHDYCFDTSVPAEHEKYAALCAELRAQGLKCFETWGGQGSHYNPAYDDVELVLETEYLFSNQWNTTPLVDGHNGLRVFDWAQDYDPYTRVKRGHYLDQTEAMRAVREQIAKCGYCGHQEDIRDFPHIFCTTCLDSEYLKESDLFLLRLAPITKTDGNRAPLTDAEREWLLPRYQAAHLHGTTERGKARIEKRRIEIEEKWAKDTAAASTERYGRRWVLDHLPGLEHELIYYPHLDRFCFGWSHPLDKADVDALVDIISEFPFAYTIKTADRGTLEGE